MHRIFNASFDPTFFDRELGGRLNAPDGSYGAMYTAQRPHGAFAETFLRSPGKDLIDLDYLASRGYAEFTVSKPLKLIKLHGPGLAHLGATAQVTHGGLPYTPYQAWSKALHAHPCHADGIAYTSRHDDDQVCYAMFDRAAAAIELTKVELDLDQDWFWEIADIYKLAAAP